MSRSTVGVHPECFTRVELCAVLYVVAPIFLFLPFWIAQPLGFITAAVMLFVSFWYLKGVDIRRAVLPLGSLVTVLVLSLLWTGLSGAGHFFYANGFDWIPRFAVARDLAVYEWPISYGNGTTEYLMRVPLGFYLIPAAIARHVGIDYLDILLYFWTALGVTLFFLVAFSGYSWKRLAAASMVFILASGLDIVGYMTRSMLWPRLGEHIEWWVPYLEYPSNTTQLFWAPNHSLGAWIATALLVRFGSNCLVLFRIIPLMLPALFLWSPLSAMGVAILWIGLVLINCRSQVRLSDFFRALPLILPMLVVAIYLTAGMSHVPLPHNSQSHSIVRGFDSQTMQFIALEAAIPALAILMWQRSSVVFISFVTLLALPFFQFGGANDLVLRTSIPALTIIGLGFASFMTQWQSTAVGKGRWVVMVAIWSLGSVTAINEIARAVFMPRWEPHLTLNLPDAFSRINPSEPFPPHYFVSIQPKTVLISIVATPVKVRHLMCANLKPLGVYSGAFPSLGHPVGWQP